MRGRGDTDNPLSAGYIRVFATTFFVRKRNGTWCDYLLLGLRVAKLESLPDHWHAVSQEIRILSPHWTVRFFEASL